MYDEPGNWKDANKEQIIIENVSTDDMLFGWDATESHSTIKTEEVVDVDTGETEEVEYYQFSAAAYRSFNSGENYKLIEPVGVNEENENKLLFIKFGFKIWEDGSDEIYKQGESKFYSLNPKSAVNSVYLGTALISFSIFLTLM